MRTIYFDHNATTPLDSDVREAMLPYLGQIWGNPSSVHHLGQRARAALDDARERAASALGCKPGEIVFTSGGTESNNQAVFGAARLLSSKGRHIITSAIEHHAVLHCCEYLAKHEGFEVTILPVDSEGGVSVDDLKQAIRSDTVLVSIMAANNEIGTIQPVADLGRVCRERGVLFHTDAVQWFGKEPVAGVQQFNADLVSICGHKFYGPKGAGVLYIRSPLKPAPLLFGGAHENERRAGTENLAGIIGLVTAMERFVPNPVFPRDLLLGLTQRILTEAERIPGLRFVGSRKKRLANTVAFAARGVDAISLLAALDMEGICASSGSACSAGSLEPSHVLAAVERESKPSALLRLSLGRDSTMEEVDIVVSTLPGILARVRAGS